MLRRVLLVVAVGSLAWAGIALAGGRDALTHRTASLRYGDFHGRTAHMCPFGHGRCEVGVSDARCPRGSAASGGGFDGLSNPPADATVGFNRPDGDGRGWIVGMLNNGPTRSEFRAMVVCVR